MPTEEERVEILKVQSQGKPLSANVNWQELAELCSGLRPSRLTPFHPLKLLPPLLWEAANFSYRLPERLLPYCWP